MEYWEEAKMDAELGLIVKNADIITANGGNTL